MNNFIKIVSFLFLIIVSTNLKADNYETNVEKEINVIESFYWFGLEEKGNFKIFADGLKKIQTIKNADNFKTLHKELKLKIEALETDFKHQIDMAFDTFYGVFPLARFLDNNILKDASSFGTYEIFDDFEVIASTSAISNLITTLVEKERKQMDVVFLSNPSNVPLQNEALYLFNQSPQFFVHNDKEVVKSFFDYGLNDNDINNFKSGKITKDYLQSLFISFDTRDLLIVNINKQLSEEKDGFYVVTANYYKPNTLTPLKSFRNMGFARDRSYIFADLILLNLFVFILSTLSCFLFYMKTSNYNSNDNLNFLIYLTLGFLISRFSPIFLIPTLNTFVPIPAPENLAILSFWYLIFVSIIILFFPFTLFQIINSKFRNLLPIQSIINNQKILGVSICAGLISWLLTSLVIYEGTFDFLYIFWLPILALFLNFIEIGKTLDKKINVYTFIFSILSTYLLLTLFTASNDYSVIASLISLILFFYRNKDTFFKKQIKDQIEFNKEKTQKWMHPYLPTFQAKINKIDKKGISLIHIKTIDELSTNILINQAKDKNTKVLEINLLDESNSFSLVNQLLQKNIQTNDNEALNNTYNLITGFIPFGNLIDMASSNTQDANLESILSAATVEFFEKFKKFKDINIIIFGSEYLDFGSAEWLKKIHHTPYNFNLNVFLVGQKVINRIETNHTINLEKLKNSDLKRYLNIELMCSLKLSEEIIKYLDQTDDDTSIDDLHSIFENLKNKNLIYFKSNWSFHKNQSIDDNILALSVDMNQSEEKQEIISQYKDFLTIACCLGYQFNIKILAQTLNLNLIETVKLLEEINLKTGFFKNYPDDQNKISFRNRNIHFHLKQILFLNNPLPEIPLRQRACCLTTANTLMSSDNNQQLEKTFLLLEKSGLDQIDKILNYGILLTKKHLSINNFESAKNTIEKCFDYLTHSPTNIKDLYNDQLITTEYIYKLELSFQKNLFIEQENLSVEIYKNWNNIKSKDDLLYPFIRSLYNSRKFKELLSIVNSSTKDKNLIKWKKLELEHYKLLVELISSDQKKIKIKNSFKKLINEVLDLDDVKLIGVKSRLLTSFGNFFLDDKEAENYLLKSIEFKKQLSDYPGLARSYGALSRLAFAYNYNFEKALKYTNKWYEFNKQLNDEFGIISANNFFGKIHYKNYENKQEPNELSLSKSYYQKNLKLLKKTSDAGGKLQILLSYADLMEISKKEKLIDEFEKLSDVLLKELKQFGEIKSQAYKNMILESFKPIKKSNDNNYKSAKLILS